MFYQSKGKKPLFVQLVLDNIWSLYEAVMKRWEETCKAFTESLSGGVLNYSSKECMLDITDTACVFLTEIKKKLRRSLPHWAWKLVPGSHGMQTPKFTLMPFVVSGSLYLMQSFVSFRKMQLFVLLAIHRLERVHSNSVMTWLIWC